MLRCDGQQLDSRLDLSRLLHGREEYVQSVEIKIEINYISVLCILLMILNGTKEFPFLLDT